jgi:hypothetical protein
MTRDPWKLVTDEAQLRAGMYCEVRTCSYCGKRDRFLITAGPLAAEPLTWNTKLQMDEATPTGAMLWEASGGCVNFNRTRGTLYDAINLRRLYALIDDDTAADETTVTRRREMVK